VVTWNARILRHVKCRQGQNVLELFQQMQQESVQPDSVAFVGVLNACARKLPLKRVGGFSADSGTWMGFRCLCGEEFAGHVCKVWEHGGCLKSFQQDAISRFGNLDCHTCRMCHAWAW
jgi:pentatricopeptide repeat protein